MKRFTCMTLLALTALPTQALELSGNLLLVNNYLWRGMTLSLEDPSLQGSLTLEHDSGLFAGVSAESYRYRDEQGQRVDDHELDLYGGYFHSLTDELGLQADVSVYTYGDASHNTEWGLGLYHSDGSVALYYDQDFETWYAQLEYGLPLSERVSLNLHGGYYLDNDQYYGFGQDHFYDVAATLSWAVLPYLNLSAGATYHEFEKGYGLAAIELTF